MIKYYGFTVDFVNGLSIDEYWMFKDAMVRMQAEEQLMMMRASAFPYLKPSDFEKTKSSVVRTASGAYPREVTHEEMARILNG